MNYVPIFVPVLLALLMVAAVSYKPQGAHRINAFGVLPAMAVAVTLWQPHGMPIQIPARGC
jgi:hypothetical protein